jgi:uncharacterized RDD family membrane protein YckC
MKLFNQITLQTPESVELDFTLAGIGNRAYALILDYIFLGLILILDLVVWSFFSYYLLELIPDSQITKNISLWLFAIQLLILFGIYLGYFVIFETLWQGQTPGKKKAKIRVIRDDGRIARLPQATLRALFRPIDDLFFLGVFLIVFTKKEKRVGDFIAGTLVIQEKNTGEKATLIISNQAVSVASLLQIKADISQLLPEDFATIKKYLESRKEMIPRARKEVSLRLANQAKEIIGLSTIPPNISANLFLEAIYLAYQKNNY